MLLSCLPVAGGEEQRNPMGCGISHVSLTLSICCYSNTCSGHLLSGKCVLMCPLLFMSVTLDLLTQPSPPTSLAYKVPPQRQVGSEQVEGRPRDAGIKE